MKKQVFAELERILDERLRSSQGPDENLTAIIKASREASQAVNRWELINTIYLILLAGIHNTSNLIHWCLLYLSSDPAWAEELREVLTQWDTANFKGMNQFPKDYADFCSKVGLHRSQLIPQKLHQSTDG